MNKLLLKIKRIVLCSGNLFETNPVAMVSILVGTIVGIIVCIFGGPYDPGLQYFYIAAVAALYFSAGSILTESIFDATERILRLVGYVVFIITSVFCAVYILGDNLYNEDVVVFKFINDIYSILGYARSNAIVSSYSIALIVMLIYVSYRKLSENVDFKDYVLRLFARLFTIHIVACTLFIGGLILVLCMETLFDFEVDTSFSIFIIIVCGIYYVPAIFSSIMRPEEEVPKYINALLKYVMMILCGLGYLIVYLYALTIIISGDFPSNSVYSITIALFAFAIPTSLLVSNCTDLPGKIARIMPALFAPFIVIQGLCLGMRISEYGITPQRYLGMLVIAFEIGYIVWFYVKPNMLDKILIVITAIIIIYCDVPYINGISLSRICQHRTIERILAGQTDADISADTGLIKRVKSAVDYLTDMDGENDYIMTHFDEDEQKRINDIISIEIDDNDNDISNSYMYLYYGSDEKYLDVSGYSKVRQVSAYYGFEYDVDNEEYGPRDVSCIELEEYGISDEKVENEVNATVDLTDICDEMIRQYIKTGDADIMDIDAHIELPDGSLLWLSNITIDVNTADYTIYSIRVDGYLLQR